MMQIHPERCVKGCSTLLLLLLGAMLGWPPFTADADSLAVPRAGYRLGPNDVIRVQVFGEEDLTVEGKVGGDGKLTFPLLGPMQVGGRTVQELRNELAARLAEGYIRQPKVTVFIIRYRNFYVSGEVRTPGGYPYEEGLTVQKAISLAGGLTEKAEKRGMKVTRMTEGQVQTVPVDLGAPVLPDDTIVVAPTEKFYVTGEVVHPGGYPYEEGLSLHKAITLAGGFTEKAEKRGIKVTRLRDGLAETIRGDPEMPVLPDDIVVVEPQHHKFYASGEVKSPGGYPYKEGLSVHQALAMAGSLTEKADRGNLKVLRHHEGQEETISVGLDSLVQPDDILVVAEAQRFYVSGEVRTPGRYLYERGLTVQKAISMAGGVTEKAEQATIKVTRLKEGFAETIQGELDSSVQPDDIIVVEPQNNKFYVSGEIKSPGGYPYKHGLTVHKAITMAGGLTEKADRGNLKVLRHADRQQEETVAVKLESLVLPDDIIVVAEGQRFYVSGEVRTPGRYLYESGLTVHKAISMAGGFTERAEPGNIRITRLNEAGVETVAVLPDALVLPDDILVVDSQSHKKFYVSGEIKSPGGYPYKEGLTVQQAIAMAGGLSEKADRTGLKVVRTVNGREETVPVTQNTSVQPDDTILVQEGQRFYISGEVRTPGRYLYEKGLTVHKAISMAGGVTERAEQGMIKVTRLMGGQANTFHGEPDMPVQPDDLIVVEPQNHKKFYASGEVKSPGGYPHKEGLTVHKALAMAGGLTEKAERSHLKVIRMVDGREEVLPVTPNTPVLAEDTIVVGEGQRFYVSGEVRTPGRYLYELGMTVQKAITMAGGFTEKAEPGSIKVTRLTEAGVENLAVTLDAPVSPDDIVLVESQHYKFYVSGEVKTPGGYAYKDGLNIQKAIAMAGGPTEKADRRSLKVVRMVNGREETLPGTLNMPVLPEDTIVVLEGQKFYVTGEIKSAGRYLYEPGMTVHKAITMAGGFTEKADRAGVSVVRVNGSGIETLPVELDALVLPDDLIVVAQAQKIYVNGEVKKPGDYPYEKGLTVHKAITMAGGFTDKAAERRTKVLRKINGQEQSLRVKLEDLVLPEDIIVVPQSFF